MEKKKNKKRLKLHKHRMPLEMALALRSKHSVKESKKIYKRPNKKIFPFDDNIKNIIIKRNFYSVISLSFVLKWLRDSAPTIQSTISLFLNNRKVGNLSILNWSARSESWSTSIFTKLILDWYSCSNCSIIGWRSLQTEHQSALNSTCNGLLVTKIVLSILKTMKCG